MCIIYKQPPTKNTKYTRIKLISIITKHTASESNRQNSTPASLARTFIINLYKYNLWLNISYKFKRILNPTKQHV